MIVGNAMVVIPDTGVVSDGRAYSALHVSGKTSPLHPLLRRAAPPTYPVHLRTAARVRQTENHDLTSTLRMVLDRAQRGGIEGK
jgi:hypothetical protein